MNGSVSCVIPAYNAAGVLGQALASVWNQTCRPDETIVVDDGSCDETAAVAAAGPGIRLLRQPRQGAAAARNAGVAAAGGRWIALLDADDWWLPEKTEKMLAAAARGGSAALIYAGRWVHDEASGRRHKPPFQVRGGRIYYDLLTDNFIPTSSVLIRRDCWLELGGMDPRWEVCHDWDLWLRVARRYPVLCVAERLCVYRLHAGGLSQRRLARMRAEERDILRAHLERDRRVPAAVRRRAWAGHAYRCGLDAYSAGDWPAARACFRTAWHLAGHVAAVGRYAATFLRALGRGASPGEAATINRA